MWNAIIDAARQNRSRSLNVIPHTLDEFGEPGILVVNNGSDVGQFGVLGLGDVGITQADNDSEFATRVYMQGETPAAGTHEGRFAIALEPIASGDVGRAVVTGLVQCKINVRNQYHDRADIKDTDLTQLDSGHVGAAKILWVAGTTGTQWAIIDINHQTADTFWAKITGNAANGTNKWKYAWTEQERTSTGWQDLTGGRSGTTLADFALNSLEANNDGTGIQGNSIDIDGAVFTDNTDLEIQAVQGDPVVRMYVDLDVTAGGLAYSFEYVNAVDGECA
ncbi:MAG: hypothetical protein ACPG4Q_10035 [Phycisphaeraceae bacterium]